MASYYLIPKDLNSLAVMSCEVCADQWYNSRTSNPSMILGCGKSNAVTISFATGGTLTEPVFGTAIDLGVNPTSFEASLLAAGMNAGFKKSGKDVVLVKVSAVGTENFYATIDNNNLNFWPPATM